MMYSCLDINYFASLYSRIKKYCYATIFFCKTGSLLKLKCHPYSFGPKPSPLDPEYILELLKKTHDYALSSKLTAQVYARSYILLSSSYLHQREGHHLPALLSDVLKQGQHFIKN